MRTNSMLAMVAALGGCAMEDNEVVEEPTTAITESALELLGTYTIAGQTLRVKELDPIAYNTSRIAACGQGVLFATRTDGTLWYNADGGIGTWTKITAGSPGTKIACDRNHLFALSGSTLYHAYTHTNGQLVAGTAGAFWSTKLDGKTLTVPAGTDEISGGMGNIYALVINSSTNVSALHASQLQNPTDAQTQGTTWTLLANNLGSNLATGAGSKAAYTSLSSSLPYRKRDRAFGANPDETLYFNDSMLYGFNSWTRFPNPDVTITSLAAEDSNTLYALGTNGLGRRLVRFSFTESNCTDEVDNDANGETDAEDGACRKELATSWCATHSAGSYCIDRLENTNGYSHALVTCNGSAQPTIERGLCTKGTLGNDFLTPARANNEPANAGHYCNVHKTDGTWDFDWSGSTPCATLQARHPGSTIVRAGIYSSTQENTVSVKCSDGGVVYVGGGAWPLETAFNDVGHTANQCVFTVSPRQMRTFRSPIVTSAWNSAATGGRGYAVGHIYDHVMGCAPGTPGCTCTTSECPLPLAQFGNGETGTAHVIDTFARKLTYYNGQNSYDYVINEGTPLKSLGYGTVISSRDRDVQSPDGFGTAYQGEIYIRYDIGSDPVYAESFIAYYAHVGVRSVVTGQTVAPGQLVGYSGHNGSSTGPHLHFGVIRISNTNGRRAGSPAAGHAFGYHLPFNVVSSGHGFNPAAIPFSVDPYGWRAPQGIDPVGHMWRSLETGHDNVVGHGAWSPALFLSSEEPPYANVAH
ncbi:MAG TPA: M23 family metallopeptidase [Kofleriaceae bacterium]|nr:M23 family metallopeptidase [Kofleriaceae bacterium]